MSKSYDPREKVEITRVSKRGDYYTVEGVAEGRKVSVEIPAPSIEVNRSKEVEAYMRRGLLGTKRLEERGTRDE